MSDIIERSEIHATFVIERRYPVPVGAVWHALSDNGARDQWFGGGAEFDVHEKSHDFRVGGHGIEAGQWRGGPTSRFVSTYTDIVNEQRMVFAYDMWVTMKRLPEADLPRADETTDDQHRYDAFIEIWRRHLEELADLTHERPAPCSFTGSPWI